LIDALLEDASLPPHELVLYGRHPAHLHLVREYAAHRLGPLGWEVVASTELHVALIGAHYILHQIRYGGLEGRVEDEQLASEFGTVADETLGPGALNAALRMAPYLRAMAATIATTAPQAWVLNLTNPLSIAVAVLVDGGVTRCIGLCELPSTTARKIAALLNVPLDDLEWHYRGLNHRGFIVRLARSGVNQSSTLLQRLGNGDIGGIPASVISELRAVPTKYYALIHGRRGPALGRAEFVRALGDQILCELQAAPHATPSSLRRRRLDWYSESVVPAIAALHSARPRRQVVNLPSEDGLIRELHASVSTAGVVPEPPPDVPQRVHDLLTRFEQHERRVLEAVEHPSAATIGAALAADPTIDPSASSALADELSKRHAVSANQEYEVRDSSRVLI
jgi:6-phospho-beta-glucosidase